jgi:hypothetical protein
MTPTQLTIIVLFLLFYGQSITSLQKGCSGHNEQLTEPKEPMNSEPNGLELLHSINQSLMAATQEGKVVRAFILAVQPSQDPPHNQIFTLSPVFVEPAKSEEEAK